MNQYSVTSDYGPFSAPSDARLRRLVRELAAIAELKVIHESNAFAKATVEAGKGVVQGAQNLINDPVGIGAVPEPVFSVFGRVSEAAKRGGKSRYGDGVAQNCWLCPASNGDMPRNSMFTFTPATKFCRKNSTASPRPRLPPI